MDWRSARTGIASSGAWKSCDPEMITRRELGGSNKLRLGYMWCPRAVGACGWMVCSDVDGGARSFVECQPAALAPGPGWLLRESLPPGDGKQGHHPEAPSRGSFPPASGWSVRHI